MESALIVSSTEKGVSALEELLKQNHYQDIVIVGSGGDAKRLLALRGFDLCIVNTPLQDEFGTELAVGSTSKGITQALLLVSGEISDEVAERVENHGVFTIAKPINRQMLWNALKLIAVSYQKLQGLQYDNLKLRQKIEDIRLIDRAKCMLIECLRMTETEAHKYIEKQAMDTRLPKKEVAASILKTYGGTAN